MFFVFYQNKEAAFYGKDFFMRSNQSKGQSPLGGQFWHFGIASLATLR